MAKVCLLYFDINTGYYPSLHHGLAYIIGALKSHNHEIVLHHLTSQNDIALAARFVKGKDIDLIALSFVSNQKLYVRSFFSSADITGKLVISGGIHSTLLKEDVFNEFPKINGVCVGEAEVALINLCKKLDEKEEYESTFSFYFNTKEGVVKNPILPLQGIDDLSLPDYSLFNYKRR